MITKSDWRAVNQTMMAEARKRNSEPPTAEEMLAYSRGELSADEEARVRERLLSYPELVRTLTAQFPMEGAEPGHPDYLTDEEFARYWGALQKRMNRKGILQFPQSWTALAAALALVFGALFMHAEWKARRLARELSEPRVAADEQLLLPDGQRGGGDASAVLRAGGESSLLVVPLISQPQFELYQLELVDLNASVPRTLWSSDPLHRRDNDSFAVLVPRSFLKAGKYQIVMVGISGERRERLSTYSLRVPGQ